MPEVSPRNLSSVLVGKDGIMLICAPLIGGLAHAHYPGRSMGTLRFVHPIKQSRFRNPRETTQLLGRPDGCLLCLSCGCPSQGLGQETKDAKRRMGKAERAHQIRLVVERWRAREDSNL